MARLSKRQFNNLLIVVILGFIALIYLPDFMRQKFLPPNEKSAVAQIDQDVISLFPPDLDVRSFNFDNFRLNYAEKWQSDTALSISAAELVERWLALEGTKVSQGMVAQLQPQLTAPNSVIIELEQAAAYALVYYQLPRFWLFKNWQGQWLALSVEPQYLFPFAQ